MPRKGRFFRFVILIIDIALAIWIWTAYKEIKASEEKEKENTYTVKQADTEMARFSWYLNDVMTNGVPQGAEKVTDMNVILGKGRYIMYNDPENEHNKAEMIFGKSSFDAGQNAFTARFDPYLIYDVNKKTEKKDTSTAAIYTFTVEENQLIIRSEDMLLTLFFYRNNGRNFAFGAFLSNDGIPVYMAVELDK